MDELLLHVVDEFSSPRTLIDGTRVRVCSHANRSNKKKSTGCNRIQKFYFIESRYYYYYFIMHSFVFRGPLFNIVR